MEVGSINFQADIGACNEYMKAGKKEPVSIVISPLKVTQSEDGNALKVVFGCNLWKSCMNVGCQYSLTARPEERGRSKS